MLQLSRPRTLAAGPPSVPQPTTDRSAPARGHAPAAAPERACVAVLGEVPEAVGAALTQGHFEVVRCADLALFAQAFERHAPVAVLVGRLGGDGSVVDHCRRVRAVVDAGGEEQPVAVVMDELSDATAVACLQYVDDCLRGVMVSSAPIALAKLGALLRRVAEPPADPGTDEEVIKVGVLRLYPARYEVLVAGDPAPLTTSQFRLLLLLARRRGWVFSAEQIRRALRRDLPGGPDAGVKSLVYSLRQRLGPLGAAYVETVRDLGYRVSAPSRR